MDVIKVEEGEMLEIEIEEDLLKANQQLANANRKIFDKHGVKVIDVMGSIGSGKTSILEKLVEKLKEKYRIAVIAGDVTTTIDADRIKRHEVRTIQINTGNECHLDALMIRRAIKRLNLDELDIIFIENVGNLICPADFPLGSHKRIVVVSVTEGPYMIRKHPMIIKGADIVVINKIDLAEAMEVDVNQLIKDAKEINPKAEVVCTNAKII
ncbi:MAG: hydrogenase accessory protein HypB [Thermofilum sp. ex4484_82]|nr:MAG: hydrogenase accessory protein HypB [Thermofilum sp. ex4484_82]OYT36926.1 MAG: hydrogenase accessory protein HypB [Archaeoglobales archaeon ex4484_92]